jgi:MFS family permease
MFFLGPVFGNLIGGYLVSLYGERGTMFYAGFASALMAVTILLLRLAIWNYSGGEIPRKSSVAVEGNQISIKYKFF